MEAVHFRDLRGEDQDAARGLILAGLAEHWGELDDALNEDLKDIGASYADGRVVVAEQDGKIVGTGTVRPSGSGRAEILRMSVDRAVRRHGVGRGIVEVLVETARSWGANAVVLETSTSWSEVVEFYRSCGFRVTHEIDGEFGRDTWFEMALEPGQ